MRPVLEELLAAWLRERPLMDKEIVTEAELLNAAVEHIHKSSVGRADVAHWPNHGPAMDSECLAHAIPGRTLLSESDGNSSACSIPNDAAAKSSAGRPEALPLISVVAFSNVWPSWGLVEMD